jgi:hypothetical protein
VVEILWRRSSFLLEKEEIAKLKAAGKYAGER